MSSRRIRYLAYPLFGIAAIVAVLIIFQVITATMEQPRFMVVVGDSMLPALEPYEVVFLEPVDDIEVGDIVALDYSYYTLFSSSGYFVHRVIKVWEKDGESFLQTKGDNNKLPENAMPAEKVVGRVTGSISYLGLLIGPPGNFVIIGVALLAALYAKRKK